MARRRYQSDSPVASGPRRAVIYARVSSKEQEREGYSIPAQLKLLREYAAEHGMYVASEYIDVETAKQSGRTGFNEMVGHLRRPTTNRPVVLVEKTDRLYRNLKDWVTLDELDLEIHFVKEGVVLSTDSRSSEKFMHGIKVLMAKNYIDNLSEEVRKGMQEKAEQGVWPSRAPLGYRNVTGQDGKRTIELDPAAAPVIEQMFQWYSTGRYSLRDITLRVQAAGLQFRATGARVPKTTVNQILRNPLYQGDIPWNGRLYRGTHQPLVSREVWATVQDVLAGRPGKHRQTRREFAFAGLITCGHCGCSLTAELKKGRYVYYHCTGFRGKCGEPYVREEVLEHQFTELLGQIRIGRDVLDWATEALRQSHAEAKRLHDEAISRLQDQYAVLQHRIDAIYIDKLDGKIDSLTYDRLSDEWRCEQARVLSAMESHQSSMMTYLDAGARLLELASRCQELFAQQPPIEKRRLLNFVVSNCSWREGVLTPTFRKPFDLLAEAVTSAGREAEKMATGSAQQGHFDIWYPFLDEFRTLCASPSTDLQAVLLGVSELQPGPRRYM